MFSSVYRKNFIWYPDYFLCFSWQLMGCMHTLNLVFLLLDTALNSLVDYVLTGCWSLKSNFPYIKSWWNDLYFFPAFSMVQDGIFCSLELCLCDFSVDSAHLWFFMVRLLLSASVLLHKYWIWIIYKNKHQYNKNITSWRSLSSPLH